MQKIVMEVDDSVANSWRIASNRLKSDINRVVNKQLAAIMDQKEEKDIIVFLKELGQEMEAKGLTQEILDDILKDEA